MIEENNITSQPNEQVNYDEDNIRHLSDVDHIRTRPGMYIGRLSDGSQPEDGIYVLLKETIDNSVDEFRMNAGKRIEIDIEDHLRVSVRDYGRGIPQGKIIEAVSQLNTGGKYDSKAFKKSVGMNGVGIKAVNFLSSHFEAHSYRDGQVRKVVFERGILKSDVTEPSKKGVAKEMGRGGMDIPAIIKSLKKIFDEHGFNAKITDLGHMNKDVIDPEMIRHI